MSDDDRSPEISPSQTGAGQYEKKEKKKIFLFAIAVVVVLLAIYVFTVVGESNAAEENEQQDIRQIVNDYSTDKLTAEAASINSEELVVTSEGKDVSYDLPEDDFFVSIAPFVETSHPCAVHSLTGCQGEMIEEEFDVYIEDTEGNVIVDEAMESFSNGFIDLWLPRNETYHITISHNGKKAESELSTFEGDNTCITTMQLM
ncbi:CueP family metal-binding protein [Oceanobacillus massiliensis]|uniref:CueP family metal-binding protein n=2 Tax=Oceanobacillus massiliensis TaxID=1465765 RepID=UPI000287B294|nr:CueP family metal-binding protein [Oceanobacillus massiliensis]